MHACLCCLERGMACVRCRCPLKIESQFVNHKEMTQAGVLQALGLKSDRKHGDEEYDSTIGRKEFTARTMQVANAHKSKQREPKSQINTSQMHCSMFAMMPNTLHCRPLGTGSQHYIPTALAKQVAERLCQANLAANRLLDPVS